jgi:hypothetical protein
VEQHDEAFGARRCEIRATKIAVAQQCDCARFVFGAVGEVGEQSMPDALASRCPRRSIRAKCELVSNRRDERAPRIVGGEPLLRRRKLPQLDAHDSAGELLIEPARNRSLHREPP